MSTSSAAYPFLHAGFADEYRERGYVILKGVFTASEIADLKRSFDRAYAEGMTHHATWRHQNRVFWLNEHETVGRYVSGCQWQSWVDPTLDAVRTDPRMLAMLEPLIGDHLKQIINQCHWKTPGTGQTWGMHQDVRSRKPDHCFRNLAESYVQTGIAIDAHRAENGAMKIVPNSHVLGSIKEMLGGSHRDERMAALADAGFDPKNAIDVEMDEGDVALWGPFTIHGGGVNTTADNYRRLYINGYVRWQDCDRGQPVFAHGKPVPLTIPALIQYEQLYDRPEPHYAGGEKQSD